MMKPFTLAGIAIALLCQTVPAARAGDFRIVPGDRIGSVRLGMTEADVIHGLHQPTRRRQAAGLISTDNYPGGSVKARRVSRSVTIDTWLGHKPVSAAEFEDKSIKRDYLTVFFVGGRAVQIEVTSAQFATADGLTPDSSNWEKRSTSQIHYSYKWTASDPEMSSPAAKHVLGYSDDVSHGIACKYGGWGTLAPEVGPLEGSKPDAVIVHTPGTQALLNPNDADDYSGTGHRIDPPEARKP